MTLEAASLCLPLDTIGSSCALRQRCFSGIPKLARKKKRKGNGEYVNAKLDVLAALLTSLPCSFPSHLNQIRAHLLRSLLPPSLLRPAFDSAVRVLSKTKPVLALHHYLLMARATLRPGRFTLPFLLNSAGALPHPSAGAELHSRALRSGLLSSLPVANALVVMYSKCRALPLARQAFDEMSLRDVVSHNAVLGAYAHVGADMPAARKLFRRNARKKRDIMECYGRRVRQCR